MRRSADTGGAAPQNAPTPGSDPVEGSPDSSSASHLSRWSQWPLVERIEVALPVLLFVLVAITGATTSSLGNALLREDPAEPLEATWGAPVPIRSDEWLTQTPIELSVLATGASTRSPLAQEPDLIYQVSSGGIFESIMFFEGNLLRLGPWLPDAMLFAAFRAFPFLLLVLGLPPLLRTFGANRPMSWLALALCLLSPASLWWSFMPVRIMGFAAAGSSMLVLAKRLFDTDRNVEAIAASAIAGLLMARMVSYYVPWSVTVGLPLIVATVAWLYMSGSVRETARTLAPGVATGAVVLGGTLYNNLPALRAEFSTVYPGLRRVTGALTPLYSLFGAPGLYNLEAEPSPMLANQSEISSGFLICLLWGALLWRYRRAATPVDSPEHRRDRAELAALRTLFGFALLWLVWCTVNVGSAGENLPVMNQLPPERVAQTIGFVAVPIVALVLSRIDLKGDWRPAAAVAAVCGLITAVGISDLQRALATVGTMHLFGASLATAAVIFAITLHSRGWLPVVVVTVALGILGATVNPIGFGLGDLRNSQAAGFVQQLRRDAEEGGVLVATDHPGVSGLLVANGVPSLTGYQVTGPVREEWLKLDPLAAAEDAWNRGASYVRVAFDRQRGEPIAITNPVPDVIVISAHPCDLGRAGTGYVISTLPLADACLEPAGVFRWTGQEQFVFKLIG